MQRFFKKNPLNTRFMNRVMSHVSHVSDLVSQDTAQHADVVLGGATVPAISWSSLYPQHGDTPNPSCICFLQNLLCLKEGTGYSSGLGHLPGTHTAPGFYQEY